MENRNFVFSILAIIMSASFANAQDLPVKVTRTLLSPEKIVETTIYQAARQVEQFAGAVTSAGDTQVALWEPKAALPETTFDKTIYALEAQLYVNLPDVINLPEHLTLPRVLIAKSVFRALPKGEEDAHAHSGFIFKTTYQGQEEIFGVIAQHAVPIKNGHGKLGETFTARVLKDGKETDIPAKIVQMSAPTLPDIALVKFRPEDEAFLTPLTLAPQDPRPGEFLQLVGFATEQLTFMSNIPLLENSLISLRFPMEGDPDVLPGLCGSPVLNEAGEVVGTMTGAVRRKIAPTCHTGYATRNLYLQTLVDAYHGDVEKASFPLILNGEKIVDLRTDEFVSLIILRDENSKTIFKKAIQSKFPLSTIMEHLPNARYIELYIEKAWWSGYGLVEGGDILSARYVVYDLQEKQIITDRPHRNH